MAVRRWPRPAAVLASLFLILLAAGPAKAQVKVRVSVDSAGIKATPDIGSPTLVNLPLGTILEVEAKKGEWYKVTTSKEGIALIGYIHEILVEEVVEGESTSARVSGKTGYIPGRDPRRDRAQAQGKRIADPGWKGPGPGGR